MGRNSILRASQRTFISCAPSRTIRTYCQTLISNAGVASCAVTLLFAVRPQSAHLDYSFGDGKGKRGIGGRRAQGRLSSIWREREMPLGRLRRTLDDVRRVCLCIVSCRSKRSGERGWLPTASAIGDVNAGAEQADHAAHVS